MSNTEQTSISNSDSKKSGLLKRGKEKSPSLGSNTSEGESSRLQAEKSSQSRPSVDPSTTADNMGLISKKLADTASNIPSKQEEKKTKAIIYQDALSLRYGFSKITLKT